MFFSEFYKDFPEASYSETNCLSSVSGSFQILEMTSNFVITEGQSDPLKDSSSIRRTSEILWIGEDFHKASDIAIPGGKFYVRLHDYKGCHDSSTEPELGDILGGKGKVSFRNPDFVIRVYHTDRWYITREIWNNSITSDFGRRAQMRPFFSPISLSPRTARLMINLSGTVKGETILDPFCGTGGILIEGGILGRRVIGNDFSLSMSSGTKLNLKYYGIKNANVFNHNALDLDPGETVHAIVTDLPYGRNSRVSSRELRNFYSLAMKKMYDMLIAGRRMVVMINSPEMLSIPEELNTLWSMSFRVHSSLTRHILVFQKMH